MAACDRFRCSQRLFKFAQGELETVRYLPVTAITLGFSFETLWANYLGIFLLSRHRSDLYLDDH